GLAVTLWIDRPEVLARLWPALDARQADQYQAGVRVRHWTADARLDADTAVVVEAFACTLPAAVIADMAARRPPLRWINLEYLSAEDWVEGCHGLPSIDPQTGLQKTFFFPGFTAATGGLLRERD